jgi:hypothetical protein
MTFELNGFFSALSMNVLEILQEDTEIFYYKTISSMKNQFLSL